MTGLISVESLDRAAIEQLLRLAESLREQTGDEIKQLPVLNSKRVLNLFYEPSTRTRTSFDLAARTLSAEVINFDVSGSSTEKGESLHDTVKTLSAYRPDAIVVRSQYVGVAATVADWTGLAVINAGDGRNEHPTQALLDVYTLERTHGPLEDKRIWIIGDIANSRVARSNIIAFQTMGAHVTVCGPPSMIPRDMSELGCDVSYTLDGSERADVLYTLRIQSERAGNGLVPSIGEYVRNYQINQCQLRSHQVVMHPGPINRNVEVSDAVADGPQSLITAQVDSGLFIRMAVLYELLTTNEGKRRKPSLAGRLA